MTKRAKKDNNLGIGRLFGQDRIVGLAGVTNCGKTNNLIAIIKEYCEFNPERKIYIFGFDKSARQFMLNFKNVSEFSDLNQLSTVENSLIVIDEFQKLKLNDRRQRDLIESFTSFIYHNNNWLLLCSPNLRSFNSVIGGYIQRWALKTILMSSLVRGSQLKDVARSYNGIYKVINDIIIPTDTIYIPDRQMDIYLKLPYIAEVDNKKNNAPLI